MLRRVAAVGGLGNIAEGFIALRARDIAAKNADLDAHRAKLAATSPTRGPAKPGALLQPARMGTVLQFSPTYKIDGASSREERGRQLDQMHKKAREEALDAADARDAERKRLSFG